MGRETGAREHAGVSTSGVDAGIGTGDRRGARDVGQAVAGQETAEADAVEVGRVGGGDELGVALHDDLERGLRDVGGDAGRLDDGVVGGLGSAQGVTGDRDGLGRADIAVREDADGVSGVERDGVSADRRDRSAGERRGDGAVIDLVRGGDARDGKEQRSDVSRDARGLDQGVVAGVRAGEGVTRDGDVLAGPDVPVHEDPVPAGADEGDHVAREDADRAARDGRSQQRVVNLVGGRGAGDVQRQRGDIGGDAGWLDQGVVAGIGAREGVTGDRDGLARADVLISKDAGPARTDERDRVTGDRADRAARDGGASERIVSLVGRRDARDAERQRGDVRGHARGLDQGVVAGVRTRDRVTRDGDGLACADVLITEQAGPVGRVQGDRVAREDRDGATRDRRTLLRIVSLVGRRGPRDVQRQRGDIGREAGRLDEGVVTRVGAREGVARDGDGLAVADVLVGEDPCPPGADESDHIARNRADRAARDRRSQERVVSLIGGGGTGDIERQRGDVRGQARGLDEGVVSGVGAGDRVARDGDRLTRTDVLIREDPGALSRAQGDGIAADRADGAARDHRRL